MFKWLKTKRGFRGTLFMTGVIVISCGMQFSSPFFVTMGIGLGLLTIGLILGDAE